MPHIELSPEAFDGLMKSNDRSIAIISEQRQNYQEENKK